MGLLRTPAIIAVINWLIVHWRRGSYPHGYDFWFVDRNDVVQVIAIVPDAELRTHPI